MSKELIVSYTKKDFRVDTMRAQGNGGQHINKTQSTVRITHIPTGLVCFCQEHRSQYMNKKLAFQRLAAKILEYHKELEKKEVRKSGEVIRTYHTVDNRVKDHESGFQQSWDTSSHDMSDMINARNRSINEQYQEDDEQ